MATGSCNVLLQVLPCLFAIPCASKAEPQVTVPVLKLLIWRKSPSENLSPMIRKELLFSWTELGDVL